MSKPSFFLSIVLCFACASAYSVEPNTNSNRINQLQTDIATMINSSWPWLYTGESMPLPSGYTMQEWKDVEMAYEQTISQTQYSFDLARLYEKLAITQMAQHNYDLALTSLKKSISYEDADEWLELLHRLYLFVAEVEKLRGNKRQVAEALLKSVRVSDYFYFSHFEDYNTIMRAIYQQWLPNDVVFQRDFYEYYIAALAYDDKTNDYDMLSLFAKNLEKIYTREDQLKQNCVNLQLCIYDTTLTQSDKLQKIKEYNRAIAKQKIFKFAGFQYYTKYQIRTPHDCQIWSCEDETIKNNLDTIQYEENIDRARCYLLLDIALVDSIRKKDGCRSKSYRRALSELFHNHRYMIGGETVLTCLEQVNSWDVITKEDVQWIDDSLRILKPYDSYYIGREDEYFSDVDSYGDKYFYYCSSWEEILKYYDLYVPIIARVYGKTSVNYYEVLLREAYELSFNYQYTIPHEELIEFSLMDSTQRDELVRNADDIKPIQMDVISDNVYKVLKEWNGVGSKDEKLDMITYLIDMGIAMYDADVLDSAVTMLQKMSSTKQMKEKLQHQIDWANMHLGIVRKDLPLFHQSVQSLIMQTDEEFEEFINDVVGEYLTVYAKKK